MLRAAIVFLCLLNGAFSAKFKAPSWCPALARERSIEVEEYKLKTTTISDNDTSFLCQEFTVPDDRTYHIVAYEPIIGNRELVHHLVTYVCDDADELKQLRDAGGYESPKRCYMGPECTTMLPVGWAFGQANGCFDRSAGVPMGKGYYKTMVLQIHYNNPRKKSGMTDASGMRLFFTRRKRRNEISMLTLGQELLAIPPKSPSTIFTAKAFSSDSCSKTVLDGHKKYTVTAALFHMHKTGVYGRLSVIKGSTGEKVDIINEPMIYDRPTSKVWNSSRRDELITFSAGDNFELECRYDSMERSDWTFWGLGTLDEMCYVFMSVYPKPSKKISQDISNVDKYDYCERKSPFLGKCKTMFYLLLNTIYESDDADFAKSCGCSSYPATACTKGCYEFLEEWNLLGNDCLSEGDGTAFYHMTRLWVIENPADAMKVASQVVHCAGLSEKPTDDISCAPSTSKASSNAYQQAATLVFTAILSFWLFH